MATFFSKGRDGYVPFGPQPDHVYSNKGKDVQPKLIDGLFYIDHEREASGFETVTAYQEWVEGGWKQEHGSYDAAKRFGTKLIEEQGEALDAFEAYLRAGSDPDSEEGKELLSELGDVLWCATAFASNSSADIDTAIKQRSYEYAMGVGVFGGDGLEVPVWHQEAIAMATARHNVPLRDIDALIISGFEPLITPAMNIEPASGPELSYRDHFKLMEVRILAMVSYMEQQFSYGESEGYVLPGTFDGLATHIGLNVAELYLSISYIAQSQLGKSLEEVIGKNINKIEARIAAGRVDKNDGERDSTLL